MLSITIRARVIQLIELFYRVFQKSVAGKGCYIDPSVYMVGRKNIVIGNNTFIGKDSWLNVNHRNNNKSIVIEDSCIIGWRNFFSSARLIHIKSYAMITHDCRFLGADHIIDDPLSPYIITGISCDNEIVVGVNCYLGANVTVIGGASIGHGSVIGASSLVTKNIPPFSVAIGSPCCVIQRYDFTVNKWVLVDEYTADKDIYMPSEVDYLLILKQKYPIIDMSPFSTTNRFGDLT